MFNSKSSEGQSIGLIPSGTVAKATMLVRGIKDSPKTGSRYLDVELTLVGGDFNGRKVWSIIMDPTHAANNDESKAIGERQLACVLEACGVFKPGDDASYAAFNGKGITDVARAISGQTIVVKVGIKKGTEGYADKNTISSYLSPNPASQTSEQFKRVMSGTQPTGGGTFGAPAGTASFGIPKPDFLSEGKNPF
jgi:hypothetical protein